ncbi:MAG TPA: hypothetical protein ENI96_12330 [Sedimenticola thiotaurini]|uniref:Uncharacterized protein n=1 Tax=Sedimenticola thiotaurini TaxID=1543721 RepID=A0A831RQL8_9GAMM|nr:hypothetical protein [Sedimenticola thiotaurini]
MKRYPSIHIAALDRRRFLGLSAAALASVLPAARTLARTGTPVTLSDREACFYHRLNAPEGKR